MKKMLLGRVADARRVVNSVGQRVIAATAPVMAGVVKPSCPPPQPLAVGDEPLPVMGQDDYRVHFRRGRFSARRAEKRDFFGIPASGGPGAEPPEKFSGYV